MKIPEFVLFAQPTKGAALELANQLDGDYVVAAVVIGMIGEHVPVAYLVLPDVAGTPWSTK